MKGLAIFTHAFSISTQLFAISTQSFDRATRGPYFNKSRMDNENAVTFFMRLWGGWGGSSVVTVSRLF
jgi:hypothetical protein